LFCDVDLVSLNRGVHFASEAAAESNQTSGVLGQQFLVDPRPVMKSVEMRGRNQFDEIAIAGFVARKQCKVICRLTQRDRAVFVRARRDVGFAANDRFHPGILRFLIKFDRAEKVSVIGHRHRRHLEFLRLFHQLFHSNRAIEQRIFGMEMKVNKRIAGHRLDYKRQENFANLRGI